MKSVIAIVGGLFFVVALGATPLFATTNEVGGCVPQKKKGGNKKHAKLRNVVSDATPDCKSFDDPVVIPTTEVTDDLQTQITTNNTNLQNQITQNGMDINQNAMDIGNNRTDIDKNTARLNAGTVIGGSTGGGDLSTVDDIQWMGLFVSRVADASMNVENRVPVAGTLKSFFARIGGPSTPDTSDAQKVFTVFLREGGALNLPMQTNLTCTIEGPNFSCVDTTHCVDVAAGQRLSVQIESIKNGGTLNAAKANWSAKLTPGDSC